jgi:hypothetical protein
VIGFYVHHQGSGHVHRATAIARAARHPVVGFSSLPRPELWPGEWICLPDDAEGVDPTTADVTAGGTLHWVPRDHPGLAARMGRISAELATGRVRLLVADVSVEVALLARLHGVPVAVVAQPGDRTDAPHRLAYDLAEKLIAPWPERPAPGWPRAWRDKTVHVGAVSRFDGRPPVIGSPGRRVLALWGSGGLDVGPDRLQAAAVATPDWSWQIAGPARPPGEGPTNLRWHGWLSEVWTALGEADVVVTHAGQNALAEIAAARRPAVVIPQRRPHREQVSTAAELARSGTAIVAETWPEPAAWPRVLDQAARHGGAAWATWSSGRGAVQAAAVLDGLVATP